MLREWDSFKALNKVLEEDHQIPGSISKACLEVEACLKANKDNLRAFFEQCFPALLKRVFGYHDFEVSWLNAATRPGREADAKSLTALLDPQGKLFAAMHSADADKHIQFIFPLERLPAHTQGLLKTSEGRRELNRWPQYRARVRTDASGRVVVQLNIFQYFMFWTAFYVLRGSRGREGPAAQRLTRLRYNPNLGRIGSNLLPGLLHPQGTVSAHSHLYYDLLVMYLDTYLPQKAQDAQFGQPQALYSPPVKRPTYSPREVFDNDSSPGDVLFSVLIEFWLTDSAEPPPADVSIKDPSPSPQATPQPMTPGTPTTPLSSRSYSYQPPSEELVEALMNFVRYVNVQEDQQSPPRSSQYAAAWLPTTPIHTFPPPQGRLLLPVHTGLLHGPIAGPAYQLFARKLYRFLRRAIAQWPASSTTPLLPIINLWMQQVAPWQRLPIEPSHPPAPQMAPLDRALHAPVLGLGQQLTRSLNMAQTKPSAPSVPTLPAQQYSREWQMHVLASLPYYLIMVPRFFELLLSQTAYRPDSTLHDLLLVLQLFLANSELTAELKAVETAYCNFTKTQPRRGDGGYAELLPWLCDQAHDFEVAATAGAVTNPPMTVDPHYRMFGTDERSAAAYVQGILEVATQQGASPELLSRAADVARHVLPMSELPCTSGSQPATTHNSLAGAHFPHPGDWRKILYRGSMLRRPICSYEIPFLVHATVNVSEWLNRVMGLDQPYDPNYIVENIWDELMQYARRHSWHINLRYLADRKLLVWLLLLVAASCMLWKSWSWAGIAARLELDLEVDLV